METSFDINYMMPVESALQSIPYPEPDFTEQSFVDGSNGVTRSVYYWWWEYLKRNEEYITYIKTGRAPKNRRSLFKKIGNIYNHSFEEWWLSKKYTLFAGTLWRGMFWEIKTPEVLHMEADDFDNDKYLYLKIPVGNFSKREIKKHFDDFLNNHYKGQRGIRTNKKIDNVLCPIMGRVNIAALKKHLFIYDFYKRHDGKYLWQIYEMLSAPPYDLNWEIYDSIDADSCNRMSAVIGRHVRKAKALIHNVSFGPFPNYKD